MSEIEEDWYTKHTRETNSIVYKAIGIGFSVMALLYLLGWIIKKATYEG